MLNPDAVYKFMSFLTPPNTITLDHINRLIDEADVESHVFYDKELVVSYRLRSGFTVTGRAACVDPANFNYDRGIQIAREDAVNQLWRLEGYVLQLERAGFVIVNPQHR